MNPGKGNGNFTGNRTRIPAAPGVQHVLIIIIIIIIIIIYLNENELPSGGSGYNACT